MEELKISNFVLNKNLVSKINQITYGRIGNEDYDYFNIVKPDNFVDGNYVISFYKDGELVGIITSLEKDLKSNLFYYIQKYYEALYHSEYHIYYGEIIKRR